MNRITFQNPLRYGGYRIYPEGCGASPYLWVFVHEDYDGAPDANDNRHGGGATIEECIAEIEELEDEEGEA